MDKFLHEYQQLLAEPLDPKPPQWFHPSDKTSFLWFFALIILTVSLFSYFIPQIRLHRFLSETEPLQRLTLYQYEIIVQSAHSISRVVDTDTKMSQTRKKIYLDWVDAMQRWVSAQKEALPTPERMEAQFKKQRQAYQDAQAILATSPLRVLDAVDAHRALDTQLKKTSVLGLLAQLSGKETDSDLPHQTAQRPVMETLPITHAMDEVDPLLKTSYEENQRYQAAKHVLPAPVTPYEKMTVMLNQWLVFYQHAQKKALEAVSMKLRLTENPSGYTDLAKPSNVLVQTQLDEAITVEKQAKATEAMEKARSQQRASAQKAAAANAQLNKQREHEAWCNKNFVNRAICLTQKK